MKKKKQRKERLATLTPAENRVWEQYFSWYMNNSFTETEADRNAWIDLQQTFPRLKKYQGCKP